MSKIYLVLLACAVLASPASATPVSFTWTSEIDAIPPAIPIPGVSFGDPVTVEIIADNGSSSLASQQWFVDDIVAAYLTVGSYTAVYTDDFIPSGVLSVFETDASGSLSAARFSGTGETTVVDSFATGTARLYSNQVRDTQGRFAYFVDRLLGPDPTALVGWERIPDVVPEPSSALLLAMAAFGICRLRS